MMKFKYPSTPHLRTSQSVAHDDHLVTDEGLSRLASGLELVVTEKMDGGNVSLYRDDFHARSLDARSQPWDARSKAEWAAVRALIPADVRLSGESLSARRSVAYHNLPAATLIFGAWRGEFALAWDEVESLASMLGLPTAPVLYRGTDFHAACSAWRDSGRTEHTSEGFVVRLASGFNRSEFALSMAKWVRKNHVRTTADWRSHNNYELNTIKKETA